jgi:hypothetical protein
MFRGVIYMSITKIDNQAMIIKHIQVKKEHGMNKSY